MRRKLDNHALSQTGFWDSLTDGDRESLLYWAYVQDLAKRHILFHEGEKGDKPKYKPAPAPAPHGDGGHKKPKG